MCDEGLDNKQHLAALKMTETVWGGGLVLVYVSFLLRKIKQLRQIF